MNSNPLKSTYYDMKSWSFAIAITLAVHFVLFIMFSASKKTQPEINSPQQPQIMMLPINSEHSNKRIAELLEWMDNENPTLIVKPNSGAGYSSVIEQNPSLPDLKNVFNYKAKLLTQIIFPPSMEIHKIPAEYKTIKDFFEVLAPNSFAFPAEKVFSQHKNGIEYPLVENLYQNYTFPVKFFDLEEINGLIKKYDPQASTLILLNYPENSSLLPTGTIMESCGASELDKIGLNTITTQSFPKSAKNKFAGKTVYLKIDWQAPYTHKTANRG